MTACRNFIFPDSPASFPKRQPAKVEFGEEGVMASSGAKADLTKKPLAAESDRPSQRPNPSTLSVLTTKNVWSVSEKKECCCCCSRCARCSGKYTEGDSDEEDMDVELWSSLPQALLEEVLARLPLKMLFQCRVLSRAWRWGASGRPLRLEFGQQPQVGRALVHPFEKAILSVSSRWPSYCPVYLFQDGLVGYNSQSKTWETIFDLKMFPSLPEGIDVSVITSCAGALVCFASVHFHNAGELKERDSSEWRSWKPLDHEVYVVNVITKKWKRLPHRPNMQRPNVMHLTHVGSTDYEIILLTQLKHAQGSGVANIMVTQIYSSLSKTWTRKSSKSVLPTWRTSVSNFVYLDGVFYIATGSSSPIDPPLLMTHNVELGTWNTMIPPLPILLRKLVKYHVLLCGSELILVVRVLGVGGGLEDEEDEALRLSFYKDVFVRNHSFLIFKLDLATGQMKQVSCCPREKLIGVSIDQVLAFRDSIYFGGRYIPKTPMMMYNVRKEEWSYHTSAWEMPKPRRNGLSLSTWNGYYYAREPEHFYWTHSALQPGLNPFADV